MIMSSLINITGSSLPDVYLFRIKIKIFYSLFFMMRQ